MPGSKLFNFDLSKLRLDAQPDSLDFRDKMYIPTLVEVPTRINLDDYKQFNVPILNQGQEGACTGFGLSTVAHYLLRRRKVVPDSTPVSPRMFYEMAKKYDEIPGEGYSGSTARGAMKGWHKHGVCSSEAWPYKVGEVDRTLTDTRAKDALKRPLGAYFRVNHKDLVAMHSAIAEVGILYVTGNVHEGWGKIGADGVIPYQPNSKITGGHAFAIVAYDERGFWIQNSWDTWWGKGGFAQITYDDWLANGSDVWVARLGVPVQLQTEEATAATISPGARSTQLYSYSDLRPHVISIGNEGLLKTSGTYGTSEGDIEEIFLKDIPQITSGWEKKRLLLYAHGGLVGESTFVQRIAELRSSLLKAQVYPLAFVWHTDLWSTVTNILQEALRMRRPEGTLSDAMDFMIERLDDTLEPLIRILSGKAQWDEMKENAHLATMHRHGGARIVLTHLAELLAKEPTIEVHLAGHSAGSIFLAPLVQLYTTRGKVPSRVVRGVSGMGFDIETCTLWAPGISTREFKQTYLPAIKNGNIRRFTLFTLTDEAERSDQCAHIYHKSLLYLVSNALEEKKATPLLGMAKYIEQDSELMSILRSPNNAWIQAPNDAPEESFWASEARHHGDFDDDQATLKSTLMRILEPQEAVPEFNFRHSASSLRDRRMELK